MIATALASIAGSNLLRRVGRATVGRELAIAALGTLPALAALRDPALASYHAVEHKAIGGYERGEDPAGVPKEHERCGSNLVGPMLVFSIVGQVLTERLVRRPRPGRPRARGAGRRRRRRGAVRLRRAHTPIRRSGGPIHGPGYEIQRLVSTREPTAEQLEVGVAALQEVLRVEQEAADTV